MERRLTVGSTSSLEAASRLARRTLTQLEELRLAGSTVNPPAGATGRRTGPRRAIPKASIAEASDLAAIDEWLEKVGFATIGDELMRLVGEVNVDVEYNHGDPFATAIPSLHALRALALEARDLARRWERPAPFLELERVATCVREDLEAVAKFHEDQIAMFELMTPQAFEDGSYQSVAAGIQSRYQPLIETMTPSARAVCEAIQDLNRALGAT